MECWVNFLKNLIKSHTFIYDLFAAMGYVHSDWYFGVVHVSKVSMARFSEIDKIVAGKDFRRILLRRTV